MKQKVGLKIVRKKISPLIKLIDPDFINLTGKYGPLINRKLKQIIDRSS